MPSIDILVPAVAAVVTVLLTQVFTTWASRVSNKSKEDIANLSLADSFLEQRSAELSEIRTQLSETRQALAELRELKFRMELQLEELKHTSQLSEIKIVGLEEENKRLIAELTKLRNED